jgi:hypothetical protein
VAKGVEKRMRELFPRINLLFLDMDAGAGDANLHNRLYFILHGAKDDRRAKAASERIQIHPEIRPHPHDFFSHELRSGENASLYRFI